MGQFILQFDNYKRVAKVDGDNNFVNINNTNAKDYYTRNYAFNADYYDQLVAQHDYIKAIEYARSYVPNDPIKRRERNAMIDEEERKFKILTQRFKDAPDDLTKDALEFNQLVFTDGGLDNIAKNNGENIYYQQLVATKNALGGEDATKLSVTFHSGKRRLFGWDWLDFLAKDNKNTVEAFEANSGMSMKYLKGIEGIDVQENKKDGTTTLIFDKSHKLSNKILYSLPTENLYDSEYDIKGYDDDGNEVKPESLKASKPYNISWSGLGNIATDVIKDALMPGGFKQDLANLIAAQTYFSTNQGKLNMFKDAIDSAQRKQEEMDYVDEDKEFIAPAIMGPLLDENIEQLKELKNAGKITESEYKAGLSRETQFALDILANPNLSQLEVYSNFEELRNGKLGQTMDRLKDDEAQRLLRFVNHDTSNRTHINTVTFNGKVGLAITIDAKETAAKNMTQNTPAEDLVSSTPVTLYITGEGLGSLNSVIERKLNQNSLTKTSLALSDMYLQNVPYTTLDGEDIQYNTQIDGKDTYIYKGEIVGRDTVTREINKDISIRTISNQLPYDYLNNKGEIINEAQYDDRIKTYAYQIASEYYPGEHITDEYGKILNPDEVFTIIDTIGLEAFINLENSGAGRKLKTIMDVYEQLRNALYIHDFSNINR